MKKFGIAIALSALLLISIPVLSFAASSTDQDNNGLGLGRIYGNMMTTVSQALGLTSDEIRTERWNGKSLAAIAQEKGISEDQLIGTVEKERKDQLDQLVQQGKITQAQADQCLEQMDDRMKSSLERTTTGRPDWALGGGSGSRQGKGMGRGMGGHFGMQQGAANQ